MPMFLFYIQIECANCEATIHFGPVGTTMEHNDRPAISLDIASQERFYCTRCGATTYTGDLEDELFTEGGVDPDELEDEDEFDRLTHPDPHEQEGWTPLGYTESPITDSLTIREDIPRDTVYISTGAAHAQIRMDCVECHIVYPITELHQRADSQYVCAHCQREDTAS